MKVILLREVQNVGKAGDVMQVADGFARNFLIPRRLADPATEKALKNLARKQAEIQGQLAKEKAGFEAIAEKLRTIELRFTLKVGEKGQTFGSTTTQDIADELAKQGIKVERDWIELEQGIKATGEHAVKIRLPYQIAAEIKVLVEAEV